MYFLTPPNLAPTVLAKLADADDVRIAVAYFNPDHNLLAELRRIPRLRLIVSEEFAINDPYKPPSTTTVASSSYWALKCTAGSNGPEHWQNFLAESVIAIGWADIGVDPSTVNESALAAAIRRAGYSSDPMHAVRTIRQFIALKIGDLVVVCRGYPANSREPVSIHGFARVAGPFYEDRSSRWGWQFKRAAVIQPIGLQLPKAVVAIALRKGSLLGTLNRIDRVGLERLAKELGMPIHV